MTHKSHSLPVRPPPAFQEYAGDWLASRTFRECGLAERGLLMTMRFECWVNHSLPMSRESLARVLGLNLPEFDAAYSSRVKGFFSEKDGCLICPELEAYREKLINKRDAMAAGGRKGGQRTQAKQKQNEANLESTLKGLSKDEKQRTEKQKTEPSRYGDVSTPVDDTWVKEYDSFS